MIQSKLTSKTVWASLLEPYVLFFVIREVIEYLWDLAFLPICDISYVRL